ncbi:MAG: YIP1 family protein [Pyrinomonadaceae bacterium]|nr:YIP1 family protein [Pyrinomonadaceae bacterium]MBP6213559.1 YIP1 family protein [Pyrinomonadaceae bacterium]
MNDESEVMPLAPTPKAAAIEESPQMSELAMIGNVFFEPGSVFDDQRRKARFIIGGILVVLAISVFQIAFVEKFGLQKIVEARIESSSRTADMSNEQKRTIIEQQSGPIAKYITYAATPIVMFIVFLIGGLIYWLGANAMGGSATFTRGVAVWVYSSLPPTLLFMAGNLLVMFLKDPETIDLVSSQGGLLKANLGFFSDPKSMPVVYALVSSIDLFAIWGWVLAAIGLQRVAKIGSGAAWAVVLMLGLIGIAAKVVGAVFF